MRRSVTVVWGAGSFRVEGSGLWYGAQDRFGLKAEGCGVGRRIVEDIKAVDEDAGLVYFVGTKSGWLERHLYTVPLAGGEIVQVRHCTLSALHPIPYTLYSLGPIPHTLNPSPCTLRPLP